MMVRLRFGGPRTGRLAMIFALLVCTAVSVQFGTQSAGWAQSEEAVAVYLQGREAFDRGDYKTAAGLFTQAYELKPAPKLLQVIAQTYDRMGKMGLSKLYLEKYAATSPEAAEEVAEQLGILGPMFSAQLVKSARSYVADAVERATPGKPAKQTRIVDVDIDGPVFFDVPYAIFTEPAGATVYINDKEWGGQGETPYSLSLFPGRHRIWIEKDFYDPIEQEILVKPLTKDSKSQKLTLTLRRRTVPVSIEARPEGAEIVFISDDGQSKSLGTGRWKGELPAGEVKFLLRASGVGEREFTEVIRRSAIDETGSQTFLFNLRGAQEDVIKNASAAGKVEVKGTLLGARVYIDNRYVGKLPGSVAKTLSPGPHKVEVRQEGYFPFQTEIEISPDKTEQIDVPNELVALPEPSANWGGIVFTTLGAVTIAAGGVFTANTLAPDAVPILGEEDKDLAQTLSFALYGAGAASLITGILFFALGGDEVPSQASVGDFEVDAVPLPGGAAVTFEVLWP